MARRASVLDAEYAARGERFLNNLHARRVRAEVRIEIAQSLGGLSAATGIEAVAQFGVVIGTADRPPRETVTTTPTAATRRTAIDYTFPKVLARVVYVRTAREGFPVGRPVVEEKTHVAVLDRAWATEVLDANVRGKRAAVGWVRAVGEKVKGGEVVPADLPRLDRADGREFPKEREVVRFHDTRRDADNKERDKARQLAAVVAAVEKSVRPGDRRPVVRIHFLFERYTPLATPTVHQRDDAQPGLLRPLPGHHPLWYTPFTNLVTELNVAVARERLPAARRCGVHAADDRGAVLRVADGGRLAGPVPVGRRGDGGVGRRPGVVAGPAWAADS